MKRIPLNSFTDAYIIPVDSLRPCGSCKACCTVLGVEEIHKPNYAPCPHVCEKGCAIHSHRPASCRSFECWWRSGMVQGARPDKSGIIVDSMPSCVRVWEVKPGALQWKSNRKVIEKLKKQYLVVIEGTAETWGKIWVETAAPEAKTAIRQQQDEYRKVIEKVTKLVNGDG